MQRWQRWMMGSAVGVAGLLVPLAGAPQAIASTSTPTCHSASMKVSLDYSREVRTQRSAEWNGTVRYTNEGPTCVMSKVDVGIQAVTRTTHVLIGQSSLADAVGRVPFVFKHGTSASAPVGILVTYPKVALSCVAEPINTIEVTGYLYGWQSHFYSLAQWHELALCAGDHLAAVAGVLSPN